MADLRKHSSTSNLIRFTLKHATTGDGLTGLSIASSGLIISTIADNEATATTYTVAGSTIETIATLGTFAAPTAIKCRFKEVDATNHQGLYEFQFADARFAVASAKRLVISVSGATDLLDGDYEIQLTDFDMYAPLVDLNADQSGVTVGTVNNVTSLVAGTGGISVAAESFTLVTGSEVNSYADTRARDGVFHELSPSGGVTDGYYQYDVGNAGIPQSITLQYYAQSNGDDYQFSAYNWGTTTFEPVETIDGANGTTVLTITPELLIDHVGTGVNAGKVRLQVYSTTGTLFATGRTFCTYTQAVGGIPNGSTITLAASATNQNFVGNAWNLALGGQIVSGSFVSGAVSIAGTATIANGNPFIITGSVMSDCTLDAELIIARTYLPDTLTIASTSGGVGDNVRIINSASGVEGSGASVIDASGVTKTTSIQNRLYGGGIAYSINSFCTLSHETVIGGAVTLTNAAGNAEIRGTVKSLTLTSSGAAVTNFASSAGSPITVNGIGGTLNIYGMHGGITDNSSGAVTINDLGANMTDIPSIFNDTNELQVAHASGNLGVDVDKINGVAITGDGSTTPFDVV